MSVTTFVALLACSLLAILLTWAILTAQRLNRLHIRTDARLAALEAALNQRAALVEALCPNAAAQAQRAHTTPLSTTDVVERSLQERRLADLVAAECGASHPPLVAATARVELAVRFYNEAVRDTRAVRLRPAVRALALGGRASLPEFYDVAPRAYGEQESTSTNTSDGQ